MNKVLLVGATGATGQHLMRQLLNREIKVRAIVRDRQRLPEDLRDHPLAELIEASVTDMSDADVSSAVSGCDGIASCLGHTLSFKGIYGHPRRLVTDTIQRLCSAATQNSLGTLTKCVLMNTTGNRNRDLKEEISFAQKCVIGLLRLLLPPHVDNEEAADHLRTQYAGDHPSIQWVVVRPDGLVDHEEVSVYETYPSPIRSAIFDAGKTSRINVAHFMAQLLTDEPLWQQWQGQMPVIYNREDQQAET
ncbi:MAG: NAD(P)-binding oxidoreductase [Pseudomonadota bacterium]